MRTTLLIPTLNELTGMKAIMPRIQRHWVDQIVVLDGNSTDGTIEWAREQGYFVYVQKQKGLRKGLEEVWPYLEGDVVITFSPDGNSVSELIPALVEKIQAGYDMVTVSRYLDGAKSDDDDVLTRFGNWIFTLLINLCFTRGCGWRYTDAMVIYRAYRRELPYELGLTDDAAYQPMERWFSTRASWEPLLSIRVAKRKLKYAEIPGDEPPRIGGERKLQVIRWGAVYLGQIIKELVR